MKSSALLSIPRALNFSFKYSCILWSDSVASFLHSVRLWRYVTVISSVTSRDQSFTGSNDNVISNQVVSIVYSPVQNFFPSPRNELSNRPSHRRNQYIRQ